MEIPELEDEGEEDITKMVADAPRNLLQTLPALSDLADGQTAKMDNVSMGIDLSSLMACLCPEEEVSSRS